MENNEDWIIVDSGSYNPPDELKDLKQQTRELIGEVITHISADVTVQPDVWDEIP